MLKVGKDYRFNKGIAWFYIEQRWIDFVIPNYNLEKVIGVGANGVVFLAHEELTDRNVVIKAWIPKSKDIKRYRDQFLAEIRKIGKISHPNIATIYGANIYRDKICWAVYNYVEGIPLGEWLQNCRSETRRINIAKAIFETVIFYQKMGILHGDLHNRNILVGEDDKICIIDFGTSEFSKKKKTLTREICLMLRLVDDLLNGFSLYNGEHFLLKEKKSKEMSYKVDKQVKNFFKISPCCLSTSIISYINILEMLTYCKNYNHINFIDYCTWLSNSSYLNIYQLIAIYLDKDKESGCTHNIENVVMESIGEDIFPEVGIDSEMKYPVSKACDIAIKEFMNLNNLTRRKVDKNIKNNMFVRYIIATRVREILCICDDGNNSYKEWLLRNIQFKGN